MNAAIQCYKKIGHILAHTSNEVKRLIQDLYADFDGRVIQSVQGLSVMTQQEVATLVDELTDRVEAMEQGRGATTKVLKELMI